MDKEYSIIIDIGNSQVSAGLFIGCELKYRFDVESVEPVSTMFGTKLIDFLKENHINKESIKYGFICSVVPQLTRWIQIVVNQLVNVNCVLLDEKAQNYIKKDKEITEPLGGDLIADIVGATSLYGTPCIVSDLGTVNKTLLIDKNGVFLGAKFFPGLKSSFEAMNEKTALLPSIKAVSPKEKAPKGLYGKNTIDCMKTGIYWNTLYSIFYSHKVLSKELGENTKYIITGGYSQLFSEDIKKEKLIIDYDLVLKGLAIIFEKLYK